MFQPRLSSAVHFVFCLVLRAQTPVTMPFAVCDECTGALVTAVSNDSGLAAGVVDTGLGERPAVVAVAGQRYPDRHHQPTLFCPRRTAIRLVRALLGGVGALPWHSSRRPTSPAAC